MLEVVGFGRGMIDPIFGGEVISIGMLYCLGTLACNYFCGGRGMGITMRSYSMNT